MFNRALKIRIYPDNEQHILISKTFGCARKIFNLMLADKIAYYQQTGEQLYVTPVKYKAEHENCFEGHIVLLQSDSDSWTCDKCGSFNSIDFKLPIVCSISPYNRLWE